MTALVSRAHFTHARMQGRTIGENSVTLQLQACEVMLKGRAARCYLAVDAWLHRATDWSTLAEKFEIGSSLPEIIDKLVSNGILIDNSKAPNCMSGGHFFQEYFSKILPQWLDEAFSHSFWEKMMNGSGSKQLLIGWFFELYHFTKNANRHMPLAVSTCRVKSAKTKLAKHYEEEWNHYHFFSKSLGILGYSKSDVALSRPLPMTMEMGNFMRQAAREHTLCYAICSAVLEGTTVNREEYNPFYKKCAELYDIPEQAIQPIYDHLDLDIKYGHSDLFQELCHCYEMIDEALMNRIMFYGHQMVERIWMWTHSIQKYYSDNDNKIPRPGFNLETI